MLASIYRKLNERRILLQWLHIDKNKFSANQSTKTQWSYCRYVNTVFKFTRNESFLASDISKNIVRHNSNLAIEDNDSFVKMIFPTHPQIQITDEEVKNLLNLDWCSISSAEFVANFEKFSMYMNELDERPNINYDNLLQAISTLSPNFSEEEIANILNHSCKWIRKAHLKDEAKKILKTLDTECFNRLSKMNSDSQFQLCKLFHYNKYGRESIFMNKTIMKNSRKLKSLTPSKLVEFAFLITICRNLPINFYELEYNLEKNMLSFSPNDMSLISSAFLKNKAQVRSINFLVHILKSMLNNIESMTNQQMNAVYKLISSSYVNNSEIDDLLKKILKALRPKIDQFSLMTLGHISFTAGRAFIRDEKLMTSIVERFNDAFHEIGLKDIERITFAITMLNYDSSYPFYQKLLEELCSPQREKDIEEHRKSFVTTLTYLAHVNIYPINLLEKVMDPNFMNKAFVNKFAMNDVYYFLDQCIAAEVPHYTGPRLNDDLRKFLAHRFKKSVTSEQRLIKMSTGTKEVMNICQRVLNTTTGVYSDKLLPHFSYQDIVICLDEKNNPIPPEPFLSAMQPYSIKPVPQEAKNHKWIALVVSNNQMTIKGNTNFSGKLVAKIRQLKSIGYFPVVVSHDKWFELKNFEDHEKLREDYIKSLLNID